MKKKPSKGVVSIASLIVAFSFLTNPLSSSEWKASVGNFNYNFIATTVILSVVFCLFILSLKDWARKGLITVSIIIILHSLYGHLRLYPQSSLAFIVIDFLFGNFLYAIAILFFTRPKVKEQFK